MKKAKLFALGTLALGLSSKANSAENTTINKDVPVKVASVNNFEDSTKNKNNTNSVAMENSKEDLSKKFEFKQLTEKQMQDWNKFVDFVENEGYKGSPELDKSKELGYKLFDKFKQGNASVSFDPRDPNFIASVQLEMQKFAESARAFEKRRNNPNADNLMTGISKIDGFAGSKTTQFKFATFVLNKFHNDVLVSSSDLGMTQATEGNLTSTRSIIEKKMEKKPDGYYHNGKKAELWSDGRYYIQNDDGDYVAVR